MEELSRELDGKLKLEDVPEGDLKSQSAPIPQQRNSGRTYHFSGPDAAPEDGIETSEGPNGKTSQNPDGVKALTKEMDRKLKLEGGVTASSKEPEPHGEASSLPETEKSSSPRKPRQTFSFTFDEGNMRTPAGLERSTGAQQLNPSAPVWTPSPSTTKEHSLPLRLREGPSILELAPGAGDESRGARAEASQDGCVNHEAQQQTSGSGDAVKNDKDVNRSVGSEGHTGTKMQIKATLCDSTVVEAKVDRQSQTLCRNVLIYGHCRYEEIGCGFKHP